jgi:hypothetical protein
MRCPVGVGIGGYPDHGTTLRVERENLQLD